MKTQRTVAVVGAGIGRSHILEGYVTNPDGFRLLAICDLDEKKLNALADEFAVGGGRRGSTSSWRWTISTSSTCARRRWCTIR